MNCKSIQEKLVEYLLRELSESDEHVINSHLRNGCPACNAELAELHIAVAALLDSDGPPLAESIRAEIADSLRAEIAAKAVLRSRHDSTQAASSLARRATSPRSRRWIGMAALIYLPSFAAGVLLAFLFRGVSESLPVAHRSEIPLSAPFVPAEVQNDWNDAPPPTLVFTSLANPTGGSTCVWRAVYDALSGELHFFIQGLTEPPKGSQYVLVTLRDDEEPRLLLPLAPDAMGRCRAIVPGISKLEASCIEVLLQPVESSLPPQQNTDTAALDV